jgi:hypothetical protein
VLTFTSDDTPSLSIYFQHHQRTVLNYLGVPPKGAGWGAQLVVEW